jgi:hypothetical protein
MSIADKPVVLSDPEIMSGTPVFVGTRVPFQTLSTISKPDSHFRSSSKTSRLYPRSKPSPPWNKRRTHFSLVRILLDECLPRRLKHDVVGHDARTTPITEPK